MYTKDETNFHIYIHYTYWIVVFFQGIFELLHLSGAINKIGVPLFTIILLVHVSLTVQKRGRDFHAPFMSIVGFFILIGLLSTIYNRMNIISLTLFYIYTLNSYIYFLIIINENRESDIEKITKFLVALFLIQFPVIVYKFFALGQSEKGLIGTLSTTAGSVSTTVPLLVTAILFSYYLYTQQRSYLGLILAAIIFGIVGKKRAIIVYVPLTMIFTFIIYYIKSKKRLFTINNIKLIVIFVAGGTLFVVGIIKTNPTLNKEQSTWGSVDIEYTINYAQSYVSSKEEGHSEMRRMAGFLFFTNKIISSPLTTILIGDGAGKLVQSKYNRDGGTMLNMYGVRYGGRMGFIWLLLQVGIVGTFTYLYFLFRVTKFVWIHYKQQPLYLAFLSLTFVFIIDLMTYSTTFLRYEYLKGIYFFVFALIYLDVKRTNFTKMPNDKPISA